MINIECPACFERFDNTTDLGVCAINNCGHLVHDTEKCKKNVNDVCELCNKQIENFISHNDLNEKDQSLIDIKSVMRIRPKFSYLQKFIGLLRFSMTFPLIMSLMFRTFMDYLHIPLYCSPDGEWINTVYLKRLIGQIVNLLNINIMIEGKEKLKNNSKAIFICNHTNYHDLFVIGHTCDEIGFVASPAINNFALGRAITKKIPHVMIENETTSKIQEIDKVRYTEVKKSGYERMIEFLQKHNRLLICPEGMLSGTETIVEFRSGAFKCASEINCDIQPIAITYKQDVYSLVDFDLFCQPRIDVKITIMDRVKTDGSNESIKQIRENIAKVGNLKLSRVENRSQKKNKKN